MTIIKNMEIQNGNIFKDYTAKINNKFADGVLVQQNELIAINDLVTFLNWSFNKKNNFFVQDFNKKKVFEICTLYNELKTSILQPKEINVIGDLFSEIEFSKVKTLKFIIQQYIVNFDAICQVSDNKHLCEQVTKESMIILLQIITPKSIRK